MQMKKKHKHLWEAYVDAASGETYYFNRKTRMTTWDPPLEAELDVLWEPSSSRINFGCTATKTST